MNKITVFGRLTRDPEMRTTQSGVEMCSMSVAVNRRKKQDGTQEADFFNVTAFGKQAELCGQYLAKGRQVLFTGRMESSRRDKDGQSITYWNLVLEEMDFVSDGNKSTVTPQATAKYTPAEIPDDDLPF